MSYLLPVMLTITIAQWVGNIFSISMYDMVIFLRRIPYLPALLPPNVDRLVAEDVMTPAKDLFTLPRVVRVKDVIQVLQTSTNNGFPVVEEIADARGVSHRVIGMVIRSQLISLMQKKFWANDVHKYKGKVRTQGDHSRTKLRVDAGAQQPAKGEDEGMRNRGASGQTLEMEDLSADGNGDAAAAKPFKIKKVGSEAELELMNTVRYNPVEGRGVRDYVETGPSVEERIFHEMSPRSVLTREEQKNYLQTPHNVSKEQLEEMTAVEELQSEVVELTEEEMENRFLDLTMFMDSSPVTVYPSTPFRRMYRIFLQMGMRHMAVVSSESSLLGLITRKDLWIHAGVRLTDSCTRFNMRSGF